MKKVLLSLLFIGASLCAGEINIAVATNVHNAMNELKEKFSKINPNITLNVISKSSGKLTTEIIKGSSYGVFMSANMEYPELLFEEGIAITEPVVYAQGGLAFFSTTKQDFFKGIKLLKSNDIHKIAVADPKTAPYGKATIEAIKRAGIYRDVEDKLVYAKSIAQAFSYTVMTAEIGIVSKSSLFSPKMRRYKEGLDWSTINPALYTPIKQGIVLLKNAEGNAEYKAFYDFILSNTAKRIFLKHGYIY